jgi:hypothetical protein
MNGCACNITELSEMWIWQRLAAIACGPHGGPADHRRRPSGGRIRIEVSLCDGGGGRCRFIVWFARGGRHRRSVRSQAAAGCVARLVHIFWTAGGKPPPCRCPGSGKVDRFPSACPIEAGECPLRRVTASPVGTSRFLRPEWAMGARDRVARGRSRCPASGRPSAVEAPRRRGCAQDPTRVAASRGRHR